MRAQSAQYLPDSGYICSETDFDANSMLIKTNALGLRHDTNFGEVSAVECSAASVSNANQWIWQLHKLSDHQFGEMQTIQ